MKGTGITGILTTYDSSHTGGQNNKQLVPDPEAEYGYRLEEALQQQEPLENFLSEEQMETFHTDMYQPLSSQLNLLYAVVAGICLVCLLNRFLKTRPGILKWKQAGNFLLSGIFIAVLCHRWLGELPLNEITPFIAVLDAVLLFVIISLFFQGAPSKKLYLTITFLAIFELCKVLNAYGMILLERLCGYLGLPEFYLFPVYSRRLPYGTASWPADATVAFDWGCVTLILACVVMVLSVRKLACGADQNTGEIPQGELLFLLTPAFTGLLVHGFTGLAMPLLVNPILVDWSMPGSSFQRLALYILVPVLAVVTLLCILYAYDIYQKLVAHVEEKHRAEVLTGQMDQMQDHIREIEQLYTGVNSMRHDMKNYLFDIKYLLAARGIHVEEEGELAGYFTGIGAALDALNFSLHTGNPVTDVVLNGKLRQARGLGIGFDSEFQFPEGFGIDVFDLSIILNNALNNALEACEILHAHEPEAQRFITITSYCKNNMFLIRVENSFDGVLYDTQRHHLKSRKQDRARHGLGFQNIVRCAEKYFGSADFTCRDRIFSLTVMLQKAEQKAAVPDQEGDR